MRSVIAAVLASAVALPIGSAQADQLSETGRAAVLAFIEAVMAGPEALAPMLAPEFQILRANGTGFDREAYLASGVGAISIKPDFTPEDITVTADDDMMVVRYLLRIDETQEGKPVEKRAPRLTVFRRVAGQWKVVAHANFGATR